ncbi:hypothetical protein LR48_Vigan07g113100 [Vigna angularis]|uniref:Uncharacterized protein n=1 Tax=Phaseolus angularis TaxID=3914 RepID=A0A0L9UXX3_PHAAN|nr:hypothetical protein LR48_Vigan07g113100 [Vigna angularis]
MEPQLASELVHPRFLFPDAGGMEMMPRLRETHEEEERYSQLGRLWVCCLQVAFHGSDAKMMDGGLETMDEINGGDADAIRGGVVVKMMDGGGHGRTMMLLAVEVGGARGACEKEEVGRRSVCGGFGYVAESGGV